MTDPNFRELKEHVLAALPDEQLIAYIQKARTAARTEAMTLALSVLVFGYLDIVTRRVVLKVPPADVDDVAHEAILSAIRSAFSGESIGEFRGWLNRITSRRIADYHRRLEGKPKTVPLLSRRRGGRRRLGRGAGSGVRGRERRRRARDRDRIPRRLPPG